MSNFHSVYHSSSKVEGLICMDNLAGVVFFCGCGDRVEIAAGYIVGYYVIRGRFMLTPSCVLVFLCGFQSLGFNQICQCIGGRL